MTGEYWETITPAQFHRGVVSEAAQHSAFRRQFEQNYLRFGMGVAIQESDRLIAGLSINQPKGKDNE